MDAYMYVVFRNNKSVICVKSIYRQRRYRAFLADHSLSNGRATVVVVVCPSVCNVCTVANLDKA